MQATATDLRNLPLSAEAFRALCNLYSEKFGGRTPANIWNHSVPNSPLRMASPLFKALVYFRSSDLRFLPSATYGEFLDKVGYFRESMLTVPADYKRWFDAHEMQCVDSVLYLLNTANAEELAEAMLAGQDIPMEEFMESSTLNLEGIKEMATAEAAIIGRWRMEYGIH